MKFFFELKFKIIYIKFSNVLDFTQYVAIQLKGLVPDNKISDILSKIDFEYTSGAFLKSLLIDHNSYINTDSAYIIYYIMQRKTLKRNF